MSALLARLALDWEPTLGARFEDRAWGLARDLERWQMTGSPLVTGSRVG